MPPSNRVAWMRFPHEISGEYDECFDPPEKWSMAA